MRYYAEKLSAVAEGRSLRGLEAHRVLHDYRVALQKRLEKDPLAFRGIQQIPEVFSQAAVKVTSGRASHSVVDAVDENNIQAEDLVHFFEWFVTTYAAGGIRSLGDTNEIMEDLVMYYIGHYIGLKSFKGKGLRRVRPAERLSKIVTPVHDFYDGKLPE